LGKSGRDVNSRLLEAGMTAKPNKMGLNIGGNCISSQPVLRQSIVRRASVFTVRPAQNQTLSCQWLAGDFFENPRAARLGKLYYGLLSEL
jgi:hypothetical protein